MLSIFLLCFGLNLGANSEVIHWPTPDPAFMQGGDITSIVQATASGKPESATFGCVRNGGRRFHEGLDIKPQSRTRSGEAADEIYAILNGRVAYINRIAGNSSYGRYIVIEHTAASLPIYSLYAHLANIAPGIKEGDWVRGGETIATMGRSAGGYSIPKSRAHLHFELGLLKSENFQHWYNKQKFGSKNHHGIYNGMNLIGIDPVDFYQQVRSKNLNNLSDYIQSLPAAYVLQISTRKTPDFIKRYPSLKTRNVPAEEIVGWNIAYTWYGLPKQWTPLTQTDIETRHNGDISLLEYDDALLTANNRQTITIDKQGNPQMGKNLKKDLQLMFGF